MAARPRRRSGSGCCVPSANLVREHADELLRLQALDNSVPLSFGEIYAVSSAFVADVFDHHAGWADKLAGETLPPFQGGDHMVLTLREPVGGGGRGDPVERAAGAVRPEGGPGPGGCTIVLKPSEYATFAVLRLARLIAEESGLPEGVLNVVTGPGDPAGQALISHPMLDKLSFTGSRAVGQKVMMAAAAGCKRVSLELGGEEPGGGVRRRRHRHRRRGDDGYRHPRPVRPGVRGADQGAGATRRHRRVPGHGRADRHDGQLRNPFDPEVTSAPLINTRQLDRVLGLIARGQEEGARLVCGGGRTGGDELAQGNFVAPTLFADVSNDMSIAREEIFGPVLSVIPFDDEAGATSIANDTDYGPAATGWTADVRRVMRRPRRSRPAPSASNGTRSSRAPVRRLPPVRPGAPRAAGTRSSPTPSSRPSCCPSRTR